MSKHTDLPWELGTSPASTDVRLILSLNHEDNTVNQVIGQVPYGTDTEHANAAFIVRACNSHAALLEACSDLVKAHEVGMGPGAVNLRIHLAKQAIASATE